MSFREECDDGYLNQTADLDLTLLEDDTDDDLVNDGLFGGSANNISRQVPNQAPPTMAGINRRFAGYTGDVRSRSMYCPTPSPRLPQRRVSSFPFSMPGEMQAGMMSSRGLSMSALPPSMMNANPRRAAFRAMLRDQHLREISSHKALRAQHRQYRNLVNSNAGLGFFRGGLPPEIDFTRGDARNRIRRHNKLVDSYASQLRAQFSLESNDSDQCRSGLSPSDEELEVSRLDSLGPFSDFANQEMPVDPDQLRSSSSLSSMQAMSRSHPSFSDPRYADGSVAVADIPLSRNFDRFPKSLSDAYNRADLDHQDDNFADGSNLYHSDCNPLNAIRSSDVFHDTVAKRSASSYALSASELSKLMEGCELISSEHQGMVSELVFVSIGQMMPCGLAKDDRIGKYKNRRIGFVGMCCKHCGGQPGSGRYFPGSFNSFLSGKNAENIVDHMMKDCTACPPYVRSVLEALEEKERQMKLKPPHGSRKRFFFHIWTKLREYNGHGPDGASAILDCDLKEASTATEHGEDEQLDSTFSANQQSSCCDSLTDVAAPSASVC